jgi:glycosyltransferase involved in cell wall biosynthesis
MRIGIDGSCLANRRGFGRFARELVRALAAAESSHEFTVFVDGPSVDSVQIPIAFRRIVVDVSEAPSRAASATGSRSVRDMLAMSRAVAREGLDLIYFPASYSFFPVWNVPRVVVTLHDTLALAHPEWVFPSFRRRMAWKIKEYMAVYQANKIITVSETARRDVIDWFRLTADRVCVVSEGPDAIFCPRLDGPESRAVLGRYDIDASRPFWLYVGGLSPHKNLPRLIEAFAGSGAKEHVLVLVGDTGDVFHTHVPELKELIGRLGLDGRVRLTGFVPDEELAYLYSRAYALVHPSLMEGFGLPPVEAMACGLPVVCSRAGSLPEVVGDVGLFFEPTDVGSMIEALDRLATDGTLRDRLAGLALERAKRYTWSASARAALACFEEVGKTGASRRTG